MTSVVKAGIGKRRFGLRQRLWHRLAGAALLLAATALFLATSEITTDDLPTWAAIAVSLSLIFESVYRVYNFVIIHPGHVDVSRLTWGTKAGKRTKHRIRYEDVKTVSTNGLKLAVTFRLNRRLLKAFGVSEWRVDVELPSEGEANEIREAIELGRSRATEANT